MILELVMTNLSIKTMSSPWGSSHTMAFVGGTVREVEEVDPNEPMHNRSLNACCHRMRRPTVPLFQLQL